MKDFEQITDRSKRVLMFLMRQYSSGIPNGWLSLNRLNTKDWQTIRKTQAEMAFRELVAAGALVNKGTLKDGRTYRYALTWLPENSGNEPS